MSFLQSLGAEFKKAGTEVETVIEKAAPVAKFVSLCLGFAYPGLATEITAATNMVVNTEGQFAQIGAQNGTGAQKSAAVLNVVGPLLDEGLTKVGSAAAGKTSQDVVDDIVKVLNLDPSVFAELGDLAKSLTPASTTAAAA
jgi:hypothetical protein